MLWPRLGILMGIVGWAITNVYPIGYAETGPPVKAEVSADGIQRVTIILDSYSYTPNRCCSGETGRITFDERDHFDAP